MNTRFQYVYRDGSNYKQWGRVSFRGACDAALLGRLFSALDSDSLFVTHQVRLPDLFFNDGRLYADDHCFHEIVDVSATEEPPDDLLERTIGEFVEEMERASRRGWDVFDVWTRRSN